MQKKSWQERLKKKVMRLISDKNMYSIMNNTKWLELQYAMQNEVPFSPPYILKCVIDDGDIELPTFDKGVWYLGNWDDEVLQPFFNIEWVKIRPRYIKLRGNLINGEAVDETEEFLSLLKKYSIPYEEEGDGSYIIYGYKSS